MAIVFYNRRNIDLRDEAQPYHTLLQDLLGHTVGVLNIYFDLYIEHGSDEYLENINTFSVSLKEIFDDIIKKIEVAMDVEKIKIKRLEIYNLIMDLKNSSPKKWDEVVSFKKFFKEFWEIVNALEEMK